MPSRTRYPNDFWGKDGTDKEKIVNWPGVINGKIYREKADAKRILAELNDPGVCLFSQQLGIKMAMTFFLCTWEGMRQITENFTRKKHKPDYYEVIQGPARLVIDLEYNAHEQKSAEIFSGVHIDRMEASKRFIDMYFQEQYGITPLCEQYDSTDTEQKYSQHWLYPDVILEDHKHAGRGFIHGLADFHKKSKDSSDPMIKTLCDLVQISPKKFVWDHLIYTSDRFMRLLWSAKHPKLNKKPRVLCPIISGHKSPILDQKMTPQKTEAFFESIVSLTEDELNVEKVRERVIFLENPRIPSCKTHTHKLQQNKLLSTEAAKIDIPLYMLDFIEKNVRVRNNGGGGRMYIRRVDRGWIVGWTDAHVCCFGHTHRSNNCYQFIQDDLSHYVKKCHSSSCTHSQLRFNFTNNTPWIDNVPIKQGKINVLWSHCGSGKSTFMCKAIEKQLREDPDSRILIKSARKPLAEQQIITINAHLISLHQREPRFGWNNLLFRHYLERELGESLSDIPRLIVQMETFANMNLDMTYDLIILDEFVTILNRYKSKTMRHKREGYDKMHSLLADRHNTILVMDADFNYQADEFIRSCRNIDDLCGIHNRFKGYSHEDGYIHFVDRSIMMFRKESVHLEKVCQILFKRENEQSVDPCIIFCNEKIRMKEYADSLAKPMPDLKIKCYSSEEPLESDWHCNDTWINYDVILCSPHITVGTDFLKKHFYAVFGYATKTTITPREFYQQLARVRYTRDQYMYVFIDSRPTKNPLKTSIHGIVMDKIEGVKAPEKCTINELNTKIQRIDGRYCQTPDPTPYTFFRVRNKREIRLAYNDWEGEFRQWMAEKEVDVYQYAPLDVNIDLLDQVHKETKKHVQQERKEQYLADFASASIAEEHIQEIRDKKRNCKEITTMDRMSLEKAYLAEIYGEEEIPSQMIGRAKRLKKHIEMNKMVDTPMEESRAQAFAVNVQEISNGVDFVDLSQSHQHKLYLQNLLDIVGLNHFDDGREMHYDVIEKNMESSAAKTFIAELRVPETDLQRSSWRPNNNKNSTVCQEQPKNNPVISFMNTF